MALSRQFGSAVVAQRIGRIVLRIGRLFCAVKHEVGADIDERNPMGAADRSDVPRAQRIDAKGLIRVAFATIHVRVGGRVDHRIRLMIENALLDLFGVRDIHVDPGGHRDPTAYACIRPNHRVAGRFQFGTEIDAQHPVRARDQHLHCSPLAPKCSPPGPSNLKTNSTITNQRITEISSPRSFKSTSSGAPPQPF